MDEMSVTEVVEEVDGLVRGDGAAIVLVSADPKRSRVELSLDLSGVECMDCVLPPDLLHQIIQGAFDKRLAGEIEVVLDDPRR